MQPSTHSLTPNILSQHQTFPANRFPLTQTPVLPYLHDHTTAAVNHFAQAVFPPLMRIVYTVKAAFDFATDSQQRHLQVDMK